MKLAKCTTLEQVDDLWNTELFTSVDVLRRAAQIGWERGIDAVETKLGYRLDWDALPIPDEFKGDEQ